MDAAPPRCRADRHRPGKVRDICRKAMGHGDKGHWDPDTMERWDSPQVKTKRSR